MERPTILIADDEPMIVSALTRVANSAGFNAIGDTSSTQVIPLAKAHRPQLIILDLRQCVDGRDILAQLKKDPETKNIKVIILTAVEDQFTRQTCLELGAVDYELKPFDSTFMQKIRRHVGLE